MSAFLSDFLNAAGLLTRLPLPAADPRRPFRHAARAYPAVGLLIGLLAALAFALFGWLGLGDWPAAFLTLAVSLLLTGALHEDGLADVADGFGGGRDREEKLAILRDSRIGSYGVLALALSVGLRASALVLLAQAGPDEAGLAGAGLIAAHGLSRGLLPLLTLLQPLARRDGLAVGAGRSEGGDAWTALAIGFVVAWATLSFGAALLALLLGLAAVFLFGRLAERQIGGYTGDVLGALQQVLEILVLLVAVGLA
ncbi:cobalamin-5'-phosphate synthase [Tistlia consotensis]|uniref:Adenosylcobinamide-GDP ribazoletransferase n=1 Tax=Tistlia consotensis USBA 355 TaxID=560819 RepID=A0A1Y6B9V0_9PROT|nr:adenosylcobinamide-GDP ribazoletransferase [Tistlia consotensis]SME92392.1 cobalamin-5'-phosphate synthase [Tistlia consotensis USBA 355]SNR28015.1 cobalamin-5'-phosphate synthase [Tistlia consotensis]